MVFTPIKFGRLYNWYAVSDSRKISSSDDWTLDTILTTNGISANTKDTDLSYWNSPNTGATNYMGFAVRGCGYRLYGFASFKQYCIFRSYNNTNNYSLYEYNSGTVSPIDAMGTKVGLAQRLQRATTNIDGTISTYIGNDEKIYMAKASGGYDVLMSNLAETKFRNGDLIPSFGTNGINYTNAEWDALTSSACCPVNGNESNV